MRFIYQALSRILLALSLAGVAPAAVSPGKAARLGGPDLTPLGAERRGNADGSIPPWTGGIAAPSGQISGDRLTDPYPEDQALFSIAADNLARYADKLSEGQRALIQAHPRTWRMPVYATRRSASYPDWVYEAVKANATSAQVTASGKGVVNARISSPFPIPANGTEAVWNHNLRWRGIRVSRTIGQAAVTRKGRYTLTLSLQEILFPYGAPPGDRLATQFPNILFALKGKFIQPGLISGEGALAIDYIDQTRVPRQAWQYIPALRRVLRVPFLANDHPALNAENLRTVDDFELFNGTPDLYEWKLLGKKELYIPYNAYRLHSDALSDDAILGRDHIDPDTTRYELHRVWVVEGTLRPEARHVYSRRVFYLDEDSWQIAIADSYDKNGKLWRTAEAHGLNYYQVPVHWSTLEVYYDLLQGRYLATGLDNKRRPYHFSDQADPREFSPNALNYYIR